MGRGSQNSVAFFAVHIQLVFAGKNPRVYLDIAIGSRTGQGVCAVAVWVWADVPID